MNFRALKFDKIIVISQYESVEKLFSERNFQLSREKNEEGEDILGLKYTAD